MSETFTVVSRFPVCLLWWILKSLNRASLWGCVSHDRIDAPLELSSETDVAKRDREETMILWVPLPTKRGINRTSWCGPCPLYMKCGSVNSSFESDEWGSSYGLCLVCSYSFVTRTWLTPFQGLCSLGWPRSGEKAPEESNMLRLTFRRLFTPALYRAPGWPGEWGVL